MPAIKWICANPKINYDNNNDHDLYDFIRDFDSKMLAVGLLKTNDTIQLDVNNIPSLLTTPWSSTAGNGNINLMGKKLLQPMIYTFSDALQATSPIFIKFTFGMVLSRSINNATTPTTDVASAFYYKIEVSQNNTNGVLQFATVAETYPANHTTAGEMQLWGDGTTSSNGLKGQQLFPNEFSHICYSPNRGYFMVRTNPGMAQQVSNIPITTGKKGHSSFVVIQRSMVDNVPTGDTVHTITRLDTGNATVNRLTTTSIALVPITTSIFLNMFNGTNNINGKTIINRTYLDRPDGRIYNNPNIYSVGTTTFSPGLIIPIEVDGVTKNFLRLGLIVSTLTDALWSYGIQSNYSPVLYFDE